jgi:hypothetical protein
MERDRFDTFHLTFAIPTETILSILNGEAESQQVWYDNSNPYTTQAVRAEALRLYEAEQAAGDAEGDETDVPGRPDGGARTAPPLAEVEAPTPWSQQALQGSAESIERAPSRHDSDDGPAIFGGPYGDYPIWRDSRLQDAADSAEGADGTGWGVDPRPEQVEGGVGCGAWWTTPLRRGMVPRAGRWVRNLKFTITFGLRSLPHQWRHYTRSFRPGGTPRTGGSVM